MDPIPLTADALIRPIAPGDIEPLHALVCANRERLRPWFNWLKDDHQLADTAGFVEHCLRRADNNDGVECVFVVSGRLAGVVGYHPVCWPHRRTAIGYWIDTGHEGRGLVTRAVAALLDHAFDRWGLHRIEITADVNNRRSRAVPERLGFTFEGVRKDYMYRHGRFHDEAVYVMLAPDWTTLRVAVRR
ncbi:MAG: GNAT family N-acetyltransferase [Tepidisphaerales bacterium]